MRYFSQGVFRRSFFRQVMALAVAGCFIHPALGDEQVLLESKEIRVTSQDFESEIANIPEKHRAEVLASRDRIRKLLENLLVNKTMVARARSAGLDHDPEIVRQMESASEKILAQEQIKRALHEIKFPDFETRANELYRLDIAKYTMPERVHASHILVQIKERSAEDALKRIQEARALAVAGKDFGDLALEYSDDPSAKSNKGDLGFFEGKKMDPSFSAAAFAMSTPGEISEPVKTKFGYHIIQYHEKQPKKIRSFDEVKAEILKGLRDKYIAEYRQNMIGQILSDPALIFNEAAVEKYKTQQPPVNPVKLPASREMQPASIDSGPDL